MSFLAEQRQRRVDRVREMIDRLAAHGIVLDAEAILAPGLTDSTKAVGRPWIARALVDGGHVPNIAEAFNRWLSRGRPAFVPRIGASPAEVFERIHAAGGIASLAHPVLVKHDEWIPGYAQSRPRRARGLSQRSRRADDGALSRDRENAAARRQRRLRLSRRRRARRRRTGQGVASAQALRRAASLACRQARQRIVGRVGELLVEDRLQIREQRAQFSGLQQMIGRLSVHVRAPCCSSGERFVEQKSAWRERVDQRAGQRSRCRYRVTTIRSKRRGGSAGLVRSAHQPRSRDRDVWRASIVSRTTSRLHVHAEGAEACAPPERRRDGRGPSRHRARGAASAICVGQLADPVARRTATVDRSGMRCRSYCKNVRM